MTERPILFSGEMVKAILEGRKTQTRRVVKGCLTPGAAPFIADAANDTRIVNVCPYGQPGDRLWVRETMRRDPNANIWYYAAGKPEDWVTVKPGDDFSASLVWAHHKEGDVCVSIHMPRWASRITLEITKVRVERIQEISEADARDEGAGISAHEYPQWDGDPDQYRKLFRERWNMLNAKRGYGWDINPWVWVVEFMPLDIGARSEGAKWRSAPSGRRLRIHNVQSV